MKKKAKAKAPTAAAEVKAEDSGKKKEDGGPGKSSERVSKEETDSTREMLKTIVASLNQADAAKLLRRANLLEQASADFYLPRVVINIIIEQSSRVCNAQDFEVDFREFNLFYVTVACQDIEVGSKILKSVNNSEIK